MCAYVHVLIRKKKEKSGLSLLLTIDGILHAIGSNHDGIVRLGVRRGDLAGRNEQDDSIHSVSDACITPTQDCKLGGFLI